MYRDPHRYDNLIHNRRPVCSNPMESIKRAAQFAPFAALTGYDDQIAEAARITDARMILDEDEMARIDNKLQYIREHAEDKPEIEVSYFVEDAATHRGSDKDGGQYVTKRGTVRKLDEYERVIFFMDGERVYIDNIVMMRIRKENGRNNS